jgi:flagellar hook-associated protein 1 FlgK
MSGISTFFGIETTLRGLLAQQNSLDVTSHNIANANTPGYSRQQAILGASDALQVTDGARLATLASIGSGVTIEGYTRVRDQFLDLQYRAQNMQLGAQQTTDTALTQVQTSLQEPGDNGISSELAKFWSAWSDVANNNDPTATAPQQALVDQAATLSDSINQLDSQLSSAQTQAQAQYNSLTASPNGEVAQDVAQIANLNSAIKKSVAAGDQPNDLLDQRDQLLDKLSGLAQISVTDLGNGSINVNFGDAANPVVSDTTVNWPQTLNNAGPPPTSAGGQLGALNDLFKSGGTIDSLRSDLSGVAKDLADKVNAIYNPSGTGTNFFTYTSGSEASTLAVNVTASQVVASSTGNPGDNDIATAISNLRGGTTDQLYSTFVTRIGSMVQAADRQTASAQALVDSVDSQRQSTSGVSMDEEMTNMIKFQRGYQASARAMTTMDTMLDTLINRTGKVGL